MLLKKILSLVQALKYLYHKNKKGARVFCIWFCLCDAYEAIWKFHQLFAFTK